VPLPSTLADLAADPGELIAFVPEMPPQRRPAGNPDAYLIWFDDTVPGGEGQVPLFGMRLPAG